MTHSNHTQIEQLLALLSKAQPEVDEDVKNEDGEFGDSAEFETEAWKRSAAAKREQELLTFEKLKNTEFSDGIIFRRRLTFTLFNLIIYWLVFIGCIVVLQGLKGCLIPYTGFHFGFGLEANVMIALLTTTTLTVVGLFATVTSHVFQKNKEKK